MLVEFEREISSFKFSGGAREQNFKFCRFLRDLNFKFNRKVEILKWQNLDCARHRSVFKI